MSLTQSGFVIGASWKQRKVSAPYAGGTQGPDNVVATFAPSTTTYSEVFLAQYTILAAGTQVIDLRSFTNFFGTTITGTKVVGLLLKATGNTGQLKIEPGASNPATWFFGGTTPSITLNCGTGGCAIGLMDGSAYVIDATHRNILLTNPGAATITVTVYALVGTT